MLFTHQGISGPLVLSASSFMKADQFPATAEIDLKPALTADRLDQRLIRDFTLFANRDFHHALERLLPQKADPCYCCAKRYCTRFENTPGYTGTAFEIGLHNEAFSG